MRYFMHLGGEDLFVEDVEGRDLPDDAAALREAIAAIRDVTAGDVCDGHLDLTIFIAVENDAHAPLFRIDFSKAVTIFPTGNRLADILG